MNLIECRSAIDALDLSVDFAELFLLRREVFSLYPGDIENILAYAELSLTHEHLGGAVGAIEILASALTKVLDPSGDMQCGVRLAEIFVISGRLNEALAVLDALQARHPSSIFPTLVAAEMKARTPEGVDAIADLSKIYHNKEINLNDDNKRELFDVFARITEIGNEELVDHNLNFVSRGRPLEDVLIVYMVKDEGDIFFQNLKHHHYLGFRNFLIIMK